GAEAALLADHELSARRALDVGHDRAFALRLALPRLDVVALRPGAPPAAPDERPTEFRAVPLDQRLAALRARLAGLLALHRPLVRRLLERLGERPPELVEHLAVVALAGLDIVELLLEVAGELQVHDPREMRDQEVGDDLADLRGEEPPLLLGHVPPLLDG